MKRQSTVRHKCMNGREHAMRPWQNLKAAMEGASRRLEVGIRNLDSVVTISLDFNVNYNFNCVKDLRSTITSAWPFDLDLQLHLSPFLLHPSVWPPTYSPQSPTISSPKPSTCLQPPRKRFRLSVARFRSPLLFFSRWQITMVGQQKEPGNEWSVCSWVRMMARM